MNKIAMLAAALVLTAAPPFPVFAQNDAESAEVAAAREELSGIWVNPYGAHRIGQPSDPRLVRPAYEPPKLTPEYAEKTAVIAKAWGNAEQDLAGGMASNDFIIRRQLMCIPYGLPRTMSQNTSLDVQVSPTHVTMVGEIDREVRRIWLDREQKPLEEIDPGYWGRSVGRWEGATLVINTIGLRAEIFGEDFMAHSDEMVMNERIYVKEGLLYDEITLTDPLALVEPFKYLVILERAPKEFEPVEFVCDQLPVQIVGPDGKLTLNPAAL